MVVKGESVGVTYQVCGVCGNEFKVVRTRIGGRPSLYCGVECRQVSAAISVLQSRTSSVQAKATDQAWKDLKATGFRLFNGRGVNDITGIPRGPLEDEVRTAMLKAGLGAWDLLHIHWLSSTELIGTFRRGAARHHFEVDGSRARSRRTLDDVIIPQWLDQMRAVDAARGDT